jgi:hypothetical protein
MPVADVSSMGWRIWLGALMVENSLSVSESHWLKQGSHRKEDPVPDASLVVAEADRDTVLVHFEGIDGMGNVVVIDMTFVVSH